MNLEDPKFIAWMDEFDALAKDAGFETSYTREMTSPEDWWEWFECGETPDMAFHEEMMAGADGIDGDEP